MKRSYTALGNEIIDLTIENDDNLFCLALKIGLDYSSFLGFLKGYRPFPIKHLFKIKEIYGLSCEEFDRLQDLRILSNSAIKIDPNGDLEKAKLLRLLNDKIGTLKPENVESIIEIIENN